MNRALTIAGSDSGGGAGIQADLKTFMAFGVYGMSVITAITAQNTKGVTGIVELEIDIIEQQLDAVLTDIGTDAVKTGMLANPKIVELVANTIKKYKLHNVVVDPVMIAKSGDNLLSNDAVKTIKEKLIPLASVITPNIPEAETLLGYAITTEDDMKSAAIELRKLGCKVVVIKGGHLPSLPTLTIKDSRSVQNHTTQVPLSCPESTPTAPDTLLNPEPAPLTHESLSLNYAKAGVHNIEAVDIIYDGKDLITLRELFIPTLNTHGTGCTFASAIAAGLSKGFTPVEAIKTAKIFITEAIRTAPKIGTGHGPTNHLTGINTRW